MKTTLILLNVSMMVMLASCGVSDAKKKTLAPPSESSTIPWNVPVAGQGQGQFGMLPNNQYRR